MSDESRPSQSPCTLLQWDTNHFGVRIGRIVDSGLDPASLGAVDDWCCRNRIDCLYFLANVNDTVSTRTAEAGGFLLTDVRITLECDLHASGHLFHILGPEIVFSRASQNDLGWLLPLARTSFEDSRFYSDGRFAREKCDQLYEIWVRKCVEDPAQWVFILKWQEQPAGFVTCARVADAGNIGLMAVDPGFRGRGLSKPLVRQALAHFAKIELEQATVITQLRNTAAIRVYECCGYRIKSSQFWFHKWYNR